MVRDLDADPARTENCKITSLNCLKAAVLSKYGRPFSGRKDIRHGKCLERVRIYFYVGWYLETWLFFVIRTLRSRRSPTAVHLSPEVFPGGIRTA